ncbi:MAG: serine protease [Gemmataceae bacterium]|nr:serine protease [Gemmataceae bacterium]
MKFLGRILIALALGSLFSTVWADDALEESLAGVYRIFDEKVSGTAFAISHVDGEKKEHVFLVTAGHVFNQMKGQEGKLALRVRETDGSYIRREVSIAIRKGEAPLWKKHATLDIAVLPITQPEKLGLSTMPLSRIVGEKELQGKLARVGQETWTPGFPAKAEANPAGWPVLRKGIIASHPLTPSKTYKTFLLSSNTFGGDSGAPVLVQAGKEYWVAGMVQGMLRETNRSVLPYEERVAHMPLGLGIVVQGEFIREVIQELMPR